MDEIRPGDGGATDPDLDPDVLEELELWGDLGEDPEPGGPAVPRGGDGALVLVATPIGNLGDLSPRAVRALEGALIRLVAYGSLTGRELDGRLANDVLERLGLALSSARAPSRKLEEPERPPSSEPAPKTARPTANIRRRPMRSARRPPSSRKPPNVSV